MLVRELAGWDPSEYDRVLCWPLREALLSFEHHLRIEARTDYQQDLLRYAVVVPWIEKEKDRRPPELPLILKD